MTAGPAPALLRTVTEEAASAWHHRTMRCHGCAAKVDGQTLHAVLQDVLDTTGWKQSASSGDATDGSRQMYAKNQVTGHEDATVMPAVPAGQIAVQTVDHLSSCVSNPHLFGRVTAVHAMSDCYAMGATPRVALATAQVRSALQLSLLPIQSCCIVDSCRLTDIALMGTADTLPQQELGTLQWKPGCERCVRPGLPASNA